MEVRQLNRGLRDADRPQEGRGFKRYADLFIDEEVRAQQSAVQGRRREWKKAQAENVITMPKRTAVQ